MVHRRTKMGHQCHCTAPADARRGTVSDRTRWCLAPTRPDYSRDALTTAGAS
ncbi:hypothetical protein BLAT2472_110091 [Burkholderia latens]